MTNWNHLSLGELKALGTALDIHNRVSAADDGAVGQPLFDAVGHRLRTAINAEVDERERIMNTVYEVNLKHDELKDALMGLDYALDSLLFSEEGSPEEAALERLRSRINQVYIETN